MIVAKKRRKKTLPEILSSGVDPFNWTVGDAAENSYEPDLSERETERKRQKKRVSHVFINTKCNVLNVSHK